MELLRPSLSRSTTTTVVKQGCGVDSKMQSVPKGSKEPDRGSVVHNFLSRPPAVGPWSTPSSSPAAGLA